MKLLRIGERGWERPAVLVDERSYVDVSDVTDDFDEAFFGSGGVERLRGSLTDRELLPLNGQRIGAPIARPHQILCIGLNYRDHAAETGQEAPAEPIVFTKAPNTLVGPHDDVRIPRTSQKTDWEVELGIIIGGQARYLADEAAAVPLIAGYTVVNDVSERSFQLERGGQWTKGKSAETFNPCGPWLVTPDEVEDVNSLSMWLDVNGTRRQNGNTSNMIFGIHHIVWYLSQFMVLEPGDLINTGTPAGVGIGLDPPSFLRAGDTVELGIDRLGTQRQHVTGG